MTDLQEPGAPYLENLPTINSLDQNITWNLGRGLTAEDMARGDLVPAINYYFSRTIPQLKHIIRDRTERPAPTNLNKFGYVIMALMGIERGSVAKIFLNMPMICSAPIRLAASIRLIYHIYEPLLASATAPLPQIQGTENSTLPAMDRGIISTLPTIGANLPAATSQIYSIYTTAYLYLYIINSSSLARNRLTHALAIISQMEAFNISPTADFDLVPPARRNNNDVRATPRETSTTSNQVNTTNDPLRHLKELCLNKYALVVSHNLEKPEDCVICLEAMIFDPANPNRIRLTDCGHMFHADCINRWRKNQCPTCRKPTSRSSLRRTAETLQNRRRTREIPNIDILSGGAMRAGYNRPEPRSPVEPPPPLRPGVHVAVPEPRGIELAVDDRDLGREVRIERYRERAVGHAGRGYRVGHFREPYEPVPYANLHES